MKIGKIDLCERANMRIGKITSSTKYRMENCEFLQLNFGFPHLKSCRNLMFSQFRKFQKILIWEILEIFNL